MAPSTKPVRPAVSAGKGNIMPPTKVSQASTSTTLAMFNKPVRPVARSAGKRMLRPPSPKSQSIGLAGTDQHRILKIYEKASVKSSRPRLLLKFNKKYWKIAKKAAAKEKTGNSKLNRVAKKDKIQKETRHSKA